MFSTPHSMCELSTGSRAGEGEASAGVAAGRAEGAERRAGGWTADDRGRQAQARSEHASPAHPVRARPTGNLRVLIIAQVLLCVFCH